MPLRFAIQKAATMTSIRPLIVAFVLAAWSIPAAVGETADDHEATRDKPGRKVHIKGFVYPGADGSMRYFYYAPESAPSRDTIEVILIEGGSVEIRRSRKETRIKIEGGKTEIILK